MQKKWKRALVLLLAVLLLFSAMTVTASAALANGSSGSWNKLGWYGSPHWRYNFSGDGKTEWGLQHASPQGEATKLSFKNSEGDHLAYCMELGSTANEGKTTTVSSNFAQYLHPSTNLSTAEKQTYIELAFFYGYTGAATRYGHTTDEERYATQIMIWMIASGDSSYSNNGKLSVFNQYSASLNDRENGFVDKCTSNVPAANKAAIKDTLSKMKEQMITHKTIPSFMAASKANASSKIRQLAYNPATGYYENVTTLTDTNGVLSYYDFSADGVEFVKSGNTLTIRTKKIIPLNSPLTVTAKRSRAKYSNPVYLMVGGWSKDVAGQQGCAQINGNTDPVQAYMTVWTNAVGSLKLIKTADVRTGEPALPVSGIQFRVTGPNGFDQTVTTGADGTFTLGNLNAGTYTVTELNVKDYWWPQAAKTVTVTAGATASVNFQNGYKHGHVDVTKNAEDGLAKGTKFRLYGTADCGAKVDLTATVGDDGQAHFVNVLIGKYTLEEVDTPKRYIVPASQNVTVEWDKHATPTFENKLIKAKLKIIKKDADTNQPIAGAHFSLISLSGDGGTWEDGKWVAEGYTDAKGELVFENLHYGEYMFAEDIFPEGYTGTMISGDYYFQVTEDGVTITKEVTNTPIKGNLKIVKKDANTSKPLSGAGFRVFDAEGNQVGEAYTDEHGEVLFENLRYGKYTYREFKAPEGFVLDETMHTFEITKNGVTITETRTNEVIPGSISIHKTDEQGNTLAGVKFLLEYSTDGKEWFPVTLRADGSLVKAGYCTSAGLQNGMLVTDADGNAVFSGLCISTQIGKVMYRVTEVETLPGYQLLAETAYEGELSPEKEVDVSFTVVNAHTYVLPATGGMGYWPLTVIAVIFAGGAFGCAVVLRKKRRKTDQ